MRTRLAASVVPHRRLVIALMAACTVCTWPVGCTKPRAPKAKVKSGTGAKAVANATASVTASELYAAYQRDPVAADKRFKGKMLSVKGEIGTRDNKPKHYPGTVLMGLTGTDEPDAYVACYFPKSRQPLIGFLDATPQPPIIGRCAGVAQSEYASPGQKLIEVQLIDCTIQAPWAANGSQRKPMSKIQFLDALVLMGASTGHRTRDDGGGDRLQLMFQCEQGIWHELFGQPQRLSDRRDSLNPVAYQVWRHKCTDGTVTFNGNAVDSGEASYYSITSVLVE